MGLFLGSNLVSPAEIIKEGSNPKICIPLGVTQEGALSYPTENFTWSLPDTVTTINNNNILDKAFYNCNTLTSVDLSSLTTVSGALIQAFDGCTGLTSVDLSSLTTVSGGSSFNSTFQYCTGLTSVDLSSLTTVSGNAGLSSAFRGCTGLTSVDLSSLTTVSGDSGLNDTFDGCTELTSVDLSSLTTVSGQFGLNDTFRDCTKLTSINLSSLTTVSGDSVFSYSFVGCSALTSINLSSLTTVSGDSVFSYSFVGCSALADIYFNALTPSSFGNNNYQFYTMLSGIGTSIMHTLHFPANMESIIQSLAGYPNFSGPNGYVILSYDLPATSGIINFDNKTTETLYINGSIYNSNSYYHNGEETSYTIIDSNNVIYSNIITPSTVMTNYTIDVSSLFTNPNTITLATSVSDLTVTFDVNGVTMNAISDGNGNYSITTSGSGFNVNYHINGGNSYMDENGTITTTGNNITQNITMTPATESQFIRPNLTSNGTLGGDSFAVYADSEYMEEPAFYAVDDDLTSACSVRHMFYSDSETWLKYTFYNPEALKTTAIGLKLYNISDTPNLTFEASNDNINWTTLTVTNTDTSTDYVVSTLDNTSAYKYYKITLKPADDMYWNCGISDITITATCKVPTV